MNMCQATIYLGEQEIAREVTWLEPVEGGVRLATFFEEPRVVRARIRRIDFLKHRVLLEPRGEGGNEGD
jgi:predicted RNA-binding protein